MFRTHPMASLLVLNDNSTTEEFEKVLLSFSIDNASKSDFISETFSLTQKESVIKLLISKFFVCKTPVRNDVTKFAIMTLRLLLRRVTTEFTESATTLLVDSFIFMCNWSEAQEVKDPEFVLEATKCFVNVLHFSEKLRLHFVTWMDSDEMKSFDKFIKGSFQPLVARIFFYAIHDEKCANLLWSKYPSTFRHFFAQFSSTVESLDLRTPLLEVYLCDALKFFFIFETHLSVGEFYDAKMIKVLRKVWSLPTEYPGVFGDDLLSHTSQVLMVGPPKFSVDFFMKEEGDSIDASLLVSFWQRFYSLIGIEDTYQMHLIPIVFTLKHACSDSMIRQLFFQCIVEENWGNVAIKINPDYFKNRRAQIVEREKDIDKMRKADEENKRERQLKEGKDDSVKEEVEEEGEAEELTEEEVKQQKQMFDPHSDKETHLAVLIHQMSHYNSEWKHSVSELLYAICGEDLETFNQVCGIGISAGFMAERGLLSQLGNVFGQ